MKLPDPIPFDASTLPIVVQQGVGPDAPPERRLLLARAVVPLQPEDLVATLAYLTADKSETVASAAKTTLDNLPWGVLSHGISQARDPGTIDWIARAMHRKEGVPELIVQNAAAADETVVFLAARAGGNTLEIIAANQRRQQRCPAIVEALYYNPETRMGTVSTVLENAVRLGLDLSHIPGYQEIVASIFGAEAVKKVTPEAAPPPPPPEEVQDPELARALEAAAKAAAEAAGAEAGEAEGEGLDDDSFLVLLAAAMDESKAPEEEDSKESQALWTRLGSMTVPQKVRLALLGNAFARSMLIRDSRRVVYMSVLKSPSLSDKEVVAFAKNKSLCDDVVRTIAANREWTKLYPVKLALVTNPKCPPILAGHILRALIAKDLKHLANSHDVPGYISRQAKQIMQSREAGKKAGG